LDTSSALYIIPSILTVSTSSKSYSWKVGPALITTMANGYFPERLKEATLPASPAMSPGPTPQRSNALQSRITSVLAASYSDLEIRDALETLDARKVHNTAETRRNLRLDAQQELIQCNGEIIRDFGQVAQV
jgi:hypothetical protein